MSDNGTIFGAAGILTKHCAMRTRLRKAIEDNLAGQPKAASFESDRTTGHGGGLFCWAHARDAIVCERALERGDNLDGPCNVESIMRPTDSTGEAGIVEDRARSDQRDLESIERQLIQLTDRLARLGDRYLPAHLPDKAGRAKLASPGQPACWFCETQAKSFAPVMTKDPTTVAGNLVEPRLVCRPHYDWIRTNGHAPSPAETQAFVRTGRWPRRNVPGHTAAVP